MRPSRGVIARGGIKVRGRMGTILYIGLCANLLSQRAQADNSWLVTWDDTGITSSYPADQLKFLGLQEPTLTIMGR